MDRRSSGFCAFRRDLENIADIIKFCVPPAAVAKEDNGEEWPCPVDGKRSVGDSGLAHQLVGRRRLLSSEYQSLVPGADGGNGGGDEGSGGRSGVCSLVDMLVCSIKRFVTGPWLVPVNRGHVEADRRGLALVILEEARRCLSFVYANAECVAFAGWAVIRIYNLESGNLIRELHDDGSRWIRSLAVAGEGFGVKPKEVGDVDVEKVVWLAAGRSSGSVRIWDMETERCVTTLHPLACPQLSYYSGVSMSRDRRRVVHFTKRIIGRPAEAGLRVWDLSSNGTLENYEFVHGCNNRLGFELASAALLYQDESKHRSVEQCSSHAVRFERSLKSDNQRNLSSSDRRLREGTSGCLASNENNKLSEVTYSTLLMSVEDSLVAEWAEIDRMLCCRVANCEDRVLVVAVNGDAKVITILDALTSEVVNEFYSDHDVFSVAASRREDGRGLVVMGDSKERNGSNARGRFG
jgi:hypothetical protein